MNLLYLYPFHLLHLLDVLCVLHLNLLYLIQLDPRAWGEKGDEEEKSKYNNLQLCKEGQVKDKQCSLLLTFHSEGTSVQKLPLQIELIYVQVPFS